MTLTAAGRQLAEHVQRSLLEEERVLAEIRSDGSRNSGTIRMAASQGLASQFIPGAAHLYRERFLGVRFSILAQPPPLIVSSLARGDVDLSIAYASGLHTGISVVHRVTVNTCAVVSPHHPLATRESVSLEDITSYPVATSSNSTVREVVNLRSAVAGLHVDVVFECDYSDSLFDYCTRGNAVAFATPFSVANWASRGELVAIPLSEARLFERTIEILVMEGRRLSGVVEDWIGFLAQRLDEAALSGAQPVTGTGLPISQGMDRNTLMEKPP